MTTREAYLRIFGSAAVNGHRVARNRSRAGLDQSEYDHVMRECADAGPNWSSARLYAAGFRCGWLAGWGT